MNELNIREVVGLIADALSEGARAVVAIERKPGGAGCGLTVSKAPSCVLDAVTDNGYYAAPDFGGTVVAAEEVL
ncbi:hypothetical protein [Adlercreutzia caecimuris]|uniref:hypothetical protein n=1 Tax=Adlercreutzia caecimuris TaxID=671266 RepID=UPI00258DBB2D|nr:hypothetical protein [Adlercreutzia caecimuris]